MERSVDSPGLPWLRLCFQRHSEWQVHPFDVFFQAWVWIAGVGWFAM